MRERALLKFSTFYPFSNFLRITHQFLDDKVIVKQKSLTTEYDFEVNYKDIVKIVYRNHADSDKSSFALSVIGIVGILAIFFSSLLHENVTVLRTMQILFLAGIALFVWGFIKAKYCYFVDTNNMFVPAIRINSVNEESLHNAVKSVKQKSKDIVEASPKNPFPETNPVFEFIEYDVPDFLNKSTTRFYENELIDSEKSFTDEVVTRVRYKDLNSQITRGRHGNSNWISIGCNLGYVAFFVLSSMFLFGLPVTGMGIRISLIFLALALIAFLLKFVKEEYVYLQDKRNRTVYWMKISRANREKVDEIIQFLQKKISENSASLYEKRSAEQEETPIH